LATFNVTKAKKDGSGKTIFQQVGTVVIREGGEGGVLYLSWLDGDFALFKKDPKKAPAPGEEAEAA